MFVGADYENIRVLFRYTLGDLPYIKRACDRLQAFSDSTTLNIAGIDYVAKVQELIENIQEVETSISDSLETGDAQATSVSIPNQVSINYGTDGDGGIVGLESLLGQRMNELESIFEDYGLFFQQVHLVKS